MTAPPRAARVAVTYTFGGLGAVYGAWAPRIPEMKRALDLSDSTLGLALLAVGAGSLAAMLPAGAAAARWGSAAVTRALFAAHCVSVGLVGLAHNVAAFALALLLWGASGGSCDVCMNAQAVSVERRYGRPMLSGFHAAFSVGALVGAGIGSAAAAAGVPVWAQLGGFGLLLLAVGWPLHGAFVPDPPAAGPRAPVFALPTGRMLVLGIAAYAALLAESAVGDWSAVHLRDVLDAPPGAAGAGFAAFSVTMTAGRLVGDRVTRRLGRVRTIRLGAALGAAGLGCGLLTGTVAGAVAGYALLGVGLACVVPVIFGAAGQAGGHAAQSIAAVFTCGYLGFLTGPTIIGGLAHVVGLGAALWTVVVLTALVGLLAPSTRTEPAGPAGGRASAPTAPGPPRPPRPP